MPRYRLLMARSGLTSYPTWDEFVEAHDEIDAFAQARALKKDNVWPEKLYDPTNKLICKFVE